jgi:hypothetical protein
MRASSDVSIPRPNPVCAERFSIGKVLAEKPFPDETWCGAVSDADAALK